jgi:hypothetical protein
MLSPDIRVNQAHSPLMDGWRVGSYESIGRLRKQSKD